jgi:hypothetical protein
MSFLLSFVYFREIANNPYGVVFFGMMKDGEAHSDLLATSKLASNIVFGFLFLRPPHAFLVLRMVFRDMVVLPLSVGAR